MMDISRPLKYTTVAAVSGLSLKARIAWFTAIAGIAILMMSSSFNAAMAKESAARSGDTDLALIIDQGVNHSQAMALVEHLGDEIGGRLTASPAAREAENWALAKFVEWGLKNVHREGFPFGRGWWIEDSTIQMIAPRRLNLTAIPIAWTPPTKGTVTSEIIVAPMRTESDFVKWRGKLSGKIVLVSDPLPAADLDTPMFIRRSDSELAEANKFRFPERDLQSRRRALVNLDFWRKLDAFLYEERAAALITKARGNGKLLYGEGYRYELGDTPLLPAMELAQEDYLLLARLASKGRSPVLALNSNVHFDDADPNGYNVVADIPGSDPAAGYIMAGAHLDSWVAGSGAADNGAGSAIVMEAARILQQIGIRPKRTIRVALWSGEEQGLRGSLAYVARHIAHRGGERDDPDIGIDRFFKWNDLWPIQPLPQYRDLKAYFNLDHGGGRIRGIYAERNPALVPIFSKWLEPFAAMGAAHVFINDGGTGTDHYPFQAVGLPGFGFMQDNLDYGRVTHSNTDTVDHLKSDDMQQASMVMAWVLLCAANMPVDLPSEPIPAAPGSAGVGSQ